MYAVSIQNSRVLDVYDTAVFVDPGVQVFVISEADFLKISASGANGDWVYSDGAVVYDPLPLVAPASANKAEAARRLSETDWVNQPDVYDPSRTPHLVNRDAFLAYRYVVRGIAVNPVPGSIQWPEKPSAQWAE